MFWEPESPLSTDDEEWQIESWRWLLESFNGTEALRKRRLVEPAAEFVPSAEKKGHEQAEYVFGLTATLMGLSPDRFRLIPQDEAINPVVGPATILRRGRKPSLTCPVFSDHA
jgi:hypothetical protein